MKSVLIIGNGVSRLEYSNFIQSWDGEVWGCNSIYLEHHAKSIPRLDRIIGDKQAIIPAVEYKLKYNYKYAVYNKFYINKSESIRGTIPIKIPFKYVRDSGTTLVALAFTEGYDKIVCVGFDLGGKDIYVDNLHTVDKTAWIGHWRRLANDFDFSKLEFIGYDHKPFILSNEDPSKYAEYYLKGESHIPVINTKPDIRVAVIDKDRKSLTNDQTNFVDDWKGEIWVSRKDLYNDYSQQYVTRVIGDGDDEDTPFFNKFKDYRKTWPLLSNILIQSLYELYDHVYIISNMNSDILNKIDYVLKEYGAKDKVTMV